MVRILPNGDIVHDEPSKSTNKRQTGSSDTNNRFGRVLRDEDRDNNNYGQQQQQGGQQQSIFETVNQRLLANGLPRFEIGPWTMEPIVTVGLVLVLFLFGFKVFLFAILLFVIVNISNTNNGNRFSQIISSFFNANTNQNQNNNRNNRNSQTNRR